MLILADKKKRRNVEKFTIQDGFNSIEFTLDKGSLSSEPKLDIVVVESGYPDEIKFKIQSKEHADRIIAIMKNYITNLDAVEIVYIGSSASLKKGYKYRATQNAEGNRYTIGDVSVPEYDVVVIQGEG